jgi:hypothetical protein
MEPASNVRVTLGGWKVGFHQRGGEGLTSRVLSGALRHAKPSRCRPARCRRSGSRWLAPILRVALPPPASSASGTPLRPASISRRRPLAKERKCEALQHRPVFQLLALDRSAPFQGTLHAPPAQTPAPTEPRPLIVTTTDAAQRDAGGQPAPERGPPTCSELTSEHANQWVQAGWSTWMRRANGCTFGASHGAVTSPRQRLVGRAWWTFHPPSLPY